jgi:hypothetical protein
VATEIRDLTRAPEDGEPGDCWETRLPTTLMWLEDEAHLPQNEARRLGKPPHAPKDPYCTGAAPAAPKAPAASGGWLRRLLNWLTGSG